MTQDREVLGFLHIEKLGYGFLRSTIDACPLPDDIYVSPLQIERLSLKNGEFIKGQACWPKQSGDIREHYLALFKVERIDGHPVFHQYHEPY